MRKLLHKLGIHSWRYWKSTHPVYYTFRYTQQTFKFRECEVCKKIQRQTLPRVTGYDRLYWLDIDEKGG